MLNFVPLYGSLWGYACASQGMNPHEIEKVEIQNRIEKFGLRDLQFYNPDTHMGVIALPNYIKKLMAKKHEPVTRENPIKSDKLINPAYKICE